MEIVHVQVTDVGTPAKRIPSTTAGLASGYQRTNVTTMGVSAVMETGGFILVGVATMPQYLPLPLTKPSVGIKPSVVARDEDELAKGYMDADRQKLELDITKEFEFADGEATRLIDEAG